MKSRKPASDLWVGLLSTETSGQVSDLKTTIMFEPRPGLDLTRMSPPILLTISREIHSPSPVPP